jgi:urea carboxylase-associated protein 2
MSTDLHETLRGGQAWSRRLARHQRLRIRDVEGRACVSALFYNADYPIERYNMPDTLKAQFTAFLTTGRVLYSDMGRILCSIVDDACGWHDTIAGIGGAEASRARFGDGSYQTLRNEFHRNGRDNMLVELGKHGLGKRDIVSNVNFFARVVVDETGAMRWQPGNSRPGASVELRFEMDTLVLFHTCPHPLSTAPSYPRKPVRYEIFDGPPAAADDPNRLSAQENMRGFENNRIFHAGCGAH